MSESTLLLDVLSKGGVAAVLFMAVYFVSKKLALAYETRIAALERSSELCERDRIELRNMILRSLGTKPPTPGGGQ